MPQGFEWIVVAVIALIPVVLWFLALVEIVRAPEPLWVAAGQNRIAALLLVILLPLIGLVLYGLVIRPKLAQTAKR